MFKINFSEFKDKYVILGVLVFSVFYFNHTIASHLGLNFQMYGPKSTLDTLPYMSKNTMKIHKIENDKEIKMSFENGELMDLEIDGQLIDKSEYSNYEDIISKSKPQMGSKDNSQIFMWGGEDFDLDNDFFSFKLQNLDSLFEGFATSGLKMFRQLDGFEGMGDDNGEFWEDYMKRFKDMLQNDNFESLGIDTTFQFDFRNFGDEALGSDFNELDNGAKANNNFTEIIGNSLNRDELLLPNKTNTIELTGKHLKINGEKQPSNIWNKYKRIFEESTGTTLQRDSKITFDFEGVTPKRKYRSF